MSRYTQEEKAVLIKDMAEMLPAVTKLENPNIDPLEFLYHMTLDFYHDAIDAGLVKDKAPAV